MTTTMPTPMPFLTDKATAKTTTITTIVSTATTPTTTNRTTRSRRRRRRRSRIRRLKNNKTKTTTRGKSRRSCVLVVAVDCLTTCKRGLFLRRVPTMIYPREVQHLQDFIAVAVVAAGTGEAMREERDLQGPQAPLL